MLTVETVERVILVAIVVLLAGNFLMLTPVIGVVGGVMALGGIVAMLAGIAIYTGHDDMWQN